MHGRFSIIGRARLRVRLCKHLWFFGEDKCISVLSTYNNYCGGDRPVLYPKVSAPGPMSIFRSIGLRSSFFTYFNYLLFVVVLTQTTGLLNHLKPLLCYVVMLLNNVLLSKILAVFAHV